MNGMHRVYGALLVAVGLAAGLSGCANTGSSTSVAVGPDGKVQNPVQLLGQLPLPPGAAIRAEQSLIIGAGDNWVGRVVLDRQQTALNQFNQRLMFELELSGFSRVGISPLGALKTQIPNYQPLRGGDPVPPSRFERYE